MPQRCIRASARSGCAIRLKPITAGYRVLALDGVGVKGIIQLQVLKNIQRLTKLPIRVFFDLAIGTSVGGINALSIGVMQWPLDKCKKIFVEVAKKIFPKATTTAGRWCQKMAQLLRFVFKDGIYSPSGPVLRSIVGDARLRGPRASLYETKPYEQMSVAVTTIESKTSASRLLTTYMGPVTYDNNGKLASDILVREAAETTSAAPCLFPAKRIGGCVLYDGIDIPLPHVQSEVRRLFPTKESPDYILSLGCGAATAAPNTRLGCLSRFTHHQLNGMSGHQQYAKLCVTDGHSKIVRVDPVLAMEEVALDDSSAVRRLISQLKRQLGIDAELWAKMRQTSFAMISARFYFQLQNTPNVVGRHREVRCEGTVACIYEDDAAIMKILTAEYRGLMVLVDGKEYGLLPRGRAEVTFRVSSWSRRIDIRVKHNEKSASITGFPASIEEIYSTQQHQPLQQYVVQEPVKDCLRKAKRQRPAQSRMTLRKRRRVAS
ncbi:Phospholipase A I [Colletotrichum fructicola Nara gc5]|uniref:Phospholipase A I n=1 Tax=Colletotrichum fructicola (strain Nara gc5) TaxID=1213859 RepID=A0A7J6IE59_COLFN|nr:Phospholipase A I [Colletotrichum fructicola Nara gc5]